MSWLLDNLTKLTPFVQQWPTWAKTVLMLALLCLGALILIMMLFPGQQVPSALADPKPCMTDDKDLSADQTYVIESAHMVVDAPRPGGPKEATVTTTYLLCGLPALAKKKPVFKEEFHSAVDGAIVERIPSDSSERDDSENAGRQASKWSVDVSSLRPGGHLAVTTRVKFTYPAQSTGEHVHQFTPKEGQDAWCYPNESDTLRKLTIAVVSQWPLDTPQHGASNIQDKENSDTGSNGTPDIAVTGGRAAQSWVVSQTWTDLPRGKRAGILIRRQLPLSK